MTSHGIIPEEWLVSYAAGSLSEAHALIVASHIAYHSGLQQKLAEAEAIGGALMENTEPEKMSAGALDRTLSRIDRLPPQSENKPGQHHDTAAKSSIPALLRDYLGKELDELHWRFMGPGMKQVRLWTGPRGECLWLLKARGGTKIPVHDHRGGEMTLVLQGGYHVDDTPYTPGLLELADEEIESHQPLIDPGEDCICLVVTEAPIKLHSLIARLMQPLIGL